MAKRGRKKKPEAQKQRQKLTVWLSDAEKEKLVARAGTLPVSTYFRETLLRGRSPKQPPQIPAINLEAYKSLSEHIAILRQLTQQFAEHTQDEQARALRRGTEAIKKMLEDYRISLISLQNKEKGQ